MSRMPPGQTKNTPHSHHGTKPCHTIYFGSRSLKTNPDPPPLRPFQLLTWWTFLDPKASVALNVTQRRETQHGQPSVEHFSHGPQKLQTGKHLTKQVWPRLLEERRRLLVSSFAFPVPTAPICPLAVHLPLRCVPGYSTS